MFAARSNTYFLKYKILRYLSTKNVPRKVVKYTETINLPKTKFPARLSSTKRQEIERKLIEGSFSELYAYQRNNNQGQEFVLHDGPPYANGDLHMGHAVNKVLKDITLRKNVVRGNKVHYIPGWDCHGLPIELKATSAGKSSNSVDIREKSRKFASDTIEKQKQEFKSWGVMANWNDAKSIYKTFDADYIKNQLNLFLSLFDKNLIYRDLKPVFWSPSSKTALAEAELEYDPNFQSPSVLLRLKLSKLPKKLSTIQENNSSVYGVIWTTTPWTLPSNQAVCYNSSLDYSVIKFSKTNDLYIVASDLLEEFEKMTDTQTNTIMKFNGYDLYGATYYHPIDRKTELPFLPADHVQATKGTGLVHTAPAHGPDDYLVSLENKIKIKCFVDSEGKYTDDAPTFLVGKSVLNDGNSLIIDNLKNDLLYVGQIIHSYPIDWRTKKPVILRASDQWFINTEKIKEKAIQEISKVNVYPRINSDASKKSLISQLEKRPYWCISRQRDWGVPIPVFYERNTNKPVTNQYVIDRICSLLEKQGNIDFWWSNDVSSILSDDVLKKIGFNADNLIKGEDILDIWFDSGISWSYALENNKVADMYLEGYDQFTGWFQSSLMTSVAHRECSPYRSIFVHGFTVDEKGHKMSKSLGNIILPKEIVQQYGTDVLRWWVASHGTQHTSIIVSPHILQAATDSLQKIRITLKYLLGAIEESTNYKELNFDVESLNNTDKYMLDRLSHFQDDVEQLYKSYEYNRVTAVIQNFVVNQVSSFYIHLTKDRLYCGTDSDITSIKNVMNEIFTVLCKALWPIVPFLVEECWSFYDNQPIFKTKGNFFNSYVNPEIVKKMDAVMELHQQLNKQIKDINSWTLEVEVRAASEKIGAIKVLHPEIERKLHSTELCELLQVSSVTLIPDSKQLDEKDWELDVRTINEDLCPRCRRFRINNNDTVCERCDQVLNNKNK